MRIKTFYYLLPLFFAFNSFGQKAKLSSDNKKAINYYQAGVNNSRRYQFGQAIQNFESAIRKDRNFLEAYFALGSVYRRTKNYNKAITSFEQGISIAPSQDKIVKYYKLIGETYFESEDYKKSYGYLKAYLEENRNLDAKVKTTVSHLLKKATFAKEAIKKPVEFDPQLLKGGVNRFPVQYFPVLTADQSELIFTARRATKPGFDEDIYVTRKDSTGTWKVPRLISPNISQQGINEGACTISADGRVLVFTICKDRRGLGSCDLYISYKTGEHWSYPKNMKSPINSAKWESQPSLSADGRSVYFVSDRPNGYGKLDIWRSDLQDDGKWSNPVNLGPSINTKYDDITPFIHANGRTLYFSSNGHPGFGGHDLFQATIDHNSMGDAKNMGYPLNDHEDQISLFVTPDGAKGYFSHEKEQNFTYTSNIFEFVIPEEDRVKVKSIYLSGTVSDVETKEFLGAEIEIFNQENSEEVFKISSDSINGKYLIVLNEGGRYGMYISKEGYLFQEKDIDLKESSKHISYDTVDIFLKKVEVGSRTTLKNIFFDFDKYDLKPSSLPELEVFVDFLEKNPGIKAEIQGHTDNNGTEEYNLNLSNQRAKSVYNFIVSKGINPDRLLYNGKGSKHPISTNETEEGRQSNRRIEFIIR